MAKAWLLLADTRRRCWRAWWYGATPLILLTLIQTIQGRFRDMELVAWLWVGVQVLPPFAFLFFNSLQHRLPQKLISANVHRAVWMATWGYLVLLYLTVVLEVQAMNSGIGLLEYFYLSCTWLTPAVLLLLSAYYLVFFSKVKIARPDNSNILELAAQKALEESRSTGSKQCFGRIAAGDLGGAFQAAQTVASSLNEAAANELAVLSAQFHNIDHQLNVEEVSVSEAQTHINRITIGLMNLAEDI